MKRAILQNIVNRQPIFNKDVQDTYVKKLEEGQIRMESLIDQADFAIKFLKQELEESVDNKETYHKKQVIAYSKRLGLIPYYQDKNDVISISTASIIVQGLVDQQVNSNKIFSNLNQQELEIISNLKMFKTSYESLHENIDDIISYRQLQTTKTYDSNDMGQHQVNSKLEETDDILKSLNKSLKRIVVKYISFDNPSLTSQELDFRIHSIVELINKLIKNLILNNDFLVINPNPIEQQIMNQMVMNDMLITKNNYANVGTNSNQVYVRLRDYSA